MTHPDDPGESFEIEMPRAWIGRRRRALVVGIDTYECSKCSKGSELHDLKGCANDARRLGALLSENFDFGVVRLCDSAATRQAILAHLAALAGSGDVCEEVVFCFSGHGSRIISSTHGMFETLLPHDSHRCNNNKKEWGPNRDVTDREIYGWILMASKVVEHVTLIIDACRAGGIVRDLEAQPRGVQPDSRAGVLEDKTAFLLLDPETEWRREESTGARYPGSVGGRGPVKRWRPPSDIYTLLAACRDDQFCREIEDSETRQMHGILSLFLTRALLQLHGPTSWRELRDRIARRVVGRNPDQEPQLEGAVDREVFGRRQLRPEAFLKVLEWAPGEVLLDGGAARGLVLGSTWHLFPPSARRAEGEPLGTLRIHRMTATRAWGRSVADGVGGAGASPSSLVEIELGARAFEVARPLEHRFRLLIDPEGEVGHPELEAAIAGSAWLVSVDQPEQADVVLRYLSPRDTPVAVDPVPGLGPLSRPHWAVLDPSGERQLAPARDALSPPAGPLAAALVADLERLARQHFLKTLSHPAPERSLARWIDVEMLHRVGGGAWSPIEPGAAVARGEYFALRLRRRPDSPLAAQDSEYPRLYVAAIDLGLAGSVTVFHPRRGRRIAWASEVLEIGLRPDDALKVEIPEGYPYPGEPPFERAYETVLLLVSRRFTDFDVLSQTGLAQVRSGSDSPVFSILERSLGGSSMRGGGSGNLLSHPDQWGLFRCPFQVVTV